MQDDVIIIPGNEHPTVILEYQGVKGEPGTGVGNSGVDFAYNVVTTFPLKSLTGRVLQVLVAIDVPFDGSPVLSVGDSANNSRLMLSVENNPLEIGVYESNPSFKYSVETQINLYLSAVGSTQGNGTIYLIEG